MPHSFDEPARQNIAHFNHEMLMRGAAAPPRETPAMREERQGEIATCIPLGMTAYVNLPL
jgi:hypothetical protein